jgi:CelD/BcsL family acetyltransferase involved in cellulose biosynthesis
MSILTAFKTTRIDGRTLPGALAADWNRLAGDVPCRRFEWLEPWWRHYAARNDELFVLVVHSSQGNVAGIAPWYVSRSVAQGRCVRFLGSGDVCSDYLTILTTPELRTEVVAAIADHLTGEAADAWDLIELSGVDAEDAAVCQLIELLHERDHVVHRRAGESCWRLELPASWDAYVASLSKSRRERVRQIVRRSFETGRAVSHQVTQRSDLSKAYELLIDLHQKRRRSLGEPGCFADRAFTEYHREVVERFFDLGRLRLQYVLLDGRPVAAEYGLVGGSEVYFYQSGIEPDVLDQRPGWMGTINSLRSAIEQGYRTFDFMRGDEAYKASWGAKARPTIETRIVARRAAAQLRHTAWLVKHRVRRWAKARWKNNGANVNGSEV